MSLTSASAAGRLLGSGVVVTTSARPRTPRRRRRSSSQKARATRVTRCRTESSRRRSRSHVPRRSPSSWCRYAAPGSAATHRAGGGPPGCRHASTLAATATSATSSVSAIVSLRPWAVWRGRLAAGTGGRPPSVYAANACDEGAERTGDEALDAPAGNPHGRALVISVRRQHASHEATAAQVVGRAAQQPDQAGGERYLKDPGDR